MNAVAVTPEVKQRALETLDNMKDIVEREMTDTGLYASHFIEDPDLLAAGAICGGRTYCAIGTLIVAGGVSAYVDPASEESSRTDEFESWVSILTSNNPAAQPSPPGGRHLVLVHEALCDTALDAAEEHDLNVGTWKSKFESVFENNSLYFMRGADNYKEGQRILLEVIANARDIIAEIEAK